MLGRADTNTETVKPADSASGGGPASQAASTSHPTNPATAPVLQVHDLAVSYGTTVALNGASLSLESGRICGLAGMNGSGKSTLFKSIMGAVPKSRGEVQVCGTDTATARKNGLVGYVPQSEEIDWSFPVNVDQVVMMGRYGFMGPRRRPRPVDREAVDQALEMVGLTQLRNRQIGALSGGQRKRVFISRAIAQGAPLMLLDEPFAGVDKYSEATITELLHRLAASGTCLFVSTHDLNALGKLCNEVILLYRKVLYHGDVAGALKPENLAQAFGMKLPPTGEPDAAQSCATQSFTSPGTDEGASAHCGLEVNGERHSA